jgi:hypothetical protein
MAVGRERGGDSASLTRRESQLGNAGAEPYDRPARVGRSVGERRSTFVAGAGSASMNASICRA